VIVLSSPGLDVFPVDTIFVESLVESLLVMCKSLLKPDSIFGPVVSLLNGSPRGIFVFVCGSFPDGIVVSFGHVSLELPDGDVLGVVGVHSSERGSPLSVNRGTVSGISSHTEDGSDEKENSNQRHD